MQEYLKNIINQSRKICKIFNIKFDKRKLREKTI